MQWGTPWIEKRERYRIMADDAWRQWFAWRPVRLWSDDTWVWLETIEFNQPMRYNIPKYRLVK